MFQTPYQNGYSPYFQQQPRPTYYTPPMTPQQPVVSVQNTGTGGYLVQPVTGKEEALAVIADPMSAGVLLPDLGHGVIYVKRFNANTGTSDFAEFTLAQKSAEESPYVRMDTFSKALEEIRGEIAALRKVE